MARKRIQPPKSDYARGDNTLEFRLKDPKLDKAVQLADREEGRVERYRRFFSGYRLAHTNDPARLNFGQFAQNIRAGCFISLGGRDVDLFFTRTAAFLMFLKMPDFGSLHSSFPQVDFVGKASVAESLRGGAAITLVRVTGAELACLLAAHSSGDIVREELSGQAVRDAKAMLSRSEVRASGPGFDIRDFSERIAVCEAMEDTDGSRSYLIALKDDDAIYTISADPEGAFCRLSHEGSERYIKKQELI